MAGKQAPNYRETFIGLAESGWPFIFFTRHTIPPKECISDPKSRLVKFLK
jgi:hypothetical protein